MAISSLHSRLARMASKFFWWALSVPLFFKIMGIGLLVALVFGGVTLVAIRNSTSRGLYQAAKQRAKSVAQALATGLEEPMESGNIESVNKSLKRINVLLSDVRYVVIRDGTGRTIARIPEEETVDEQSYPETQIIESDSQAETIFNPEKLFFRVTTPIDSGRQGMLEIGITDRSIESQLDSVTQSIIITLAFCAVIGAGLALLLTYILTHPIQHLAQAANRIRSGDFEARANVFSADEVGRLAVAFNQMSEALQTFRQEVQQKEKARLGLIEKIVHAQEKERKSISRELHDQLGQSLLALLLAVQALNRESRVSEDSLNNIEGLIREVLEEVRRLAWGMHPSVLDDYGLDIALSRLTEKISDHSQLAIDYQYSGVPDSERLPAQVEVTLYRIAQEGISNVVRHSNATQSSVVVLQRQDEVLLLIEDNGSGFDSNLVQQKLESGLGLTGMKERAALLGGDCAVESVLEIGTTIRVKIPLIKA